jgi:hypothetical protein
MNFKNSCLAAAAMSVFAVSSVFANEWVVTDAIQGKGGASQLSVGFAGDGTVMDAMIDLSFDGGAYTAKVEALNGAACAVHPKGDAVRVITPISDQPLGEALVALCNVTLLAKNGMAKGAPALSIMGSECSRGTGKDDNCDLSSAGESIK